MHRILAAAFAACCVGLGIAHPRVAGAQQWNDERSRALVLRATERRAQQFADSGLADYRATAHGFLTFLAQVGEGFLLPPKVVKADELALEVYWRSPDLSKQRIIGRRDTLLLPTDINYHRDHLGIVQNNFPSIIRLGDGDEVKDVPHPLSEAGLLAYDYRIADSLKLSIPGRVIDVYEVKIRPRNDREAAAVGAVYIEKEEAQVVRMAFSFTRSALKDKQLEDVSIVLENSLIEGRFWLPRRQEIEIQRTGSWMDFPARGIIRGRWEIGDYHVNQKIPSAYFAGPEIVSAPRAEMAQHRWEGKLLDLLPPDVRAVTDEDVKRVQEEAREMVQAGALARARSTNLAARGVSDFARINRVEGLALGAGVRQRLGGGFDLAGSARYGLDDERAKWSLAGGWRRSDGRDVRVQAFDDYRDAGDVQETSSVRNSIAAQEFGSDYTEPFGTRGATLAATLGTFRGARWTLSATAERQHRAKVSATPARGTYAPTIDAFDGDAIFVALRADLPPTLTLFGGDTRARGELRRGSLDTGNGGSATTGNVIRYTRAFVDMEIAWPVGASQLVSRTLAGIVVGDDGEVPLQDYIFLGGPVSGPGYRYHDFVIRRGVSQRVEARLPVPFIAFSLGRWGRSPSRATLAPYANLIYGSRAYLGEERRHGVYPTLGVGIMPFFDLLRIDVARGLRHGRWTFGIDVTRDFWPIL